MEGAKKVAVRMARMPAIAMKQNKEAINRAYDMRGLVATLEYGQEMFCMTAMAHPPEGQEFRKIARNQGLRTPAVEEAALQIVDLVKRSGGCRWGRGYP